MMPQQTTPSAPGPAAARFIAPFMALLILAGCGATGLRTPGDDEYNVSSGRDEALRRSGSASEGILIFGTDRTRRAGADAGAGPGLGVNAFLWRATLDTLSFMPLVSADPFGGVIITDWYSPPQAAGERFKATAYVLGRQLRSDGVRVQVFRQVQQNGQWLDVPTAGSTNTELEDRVLARARELRVQSAGR